MDIQKLADHESLDLHEVINFKTLCLAKSKLMQGLVFDDDLRALMKKMLNNRYKRWENYRQFINVHLLKPLFLKTGQHQ